MVRDRVHSTIFLVAEMNQKTSKANAEAPATQVHAAGTTEPTPKPATSITPPDIAKHVPAGVNISKLNSHIRADGLNTGNFLTVTPFGGPRVPNFL
nr:protein SPIRAL1-like 1 [Tanacetum cinerariifolium]